MGPKRCYKCPNGPGHKQGPQPWKVPGLGHCGFGGVVSCEPRASWAGYWFREVTTAKKQPVSALRRRLNLRLSGQMLHCPVSYPLASLARQLFPVSGRSGNTQCHETNVMFAMWPEPPSSMQCKGVSRKVYFVASCRQGRWAPLTCCHTSW